MDSTPSPSLPDKEQADLTLREAQKTAEQRAQDIAYTINHALVCAATDIIDPFVGASSQKLLGHRINISFCNKTHDHGDDHHHHDHHHHGHHHPVTWGEALKHWVVGEAIGDLGAVPIAIGMQRLAPNFMHRTSMLMETVLGSFYRRGAHAAALTWAYQQHLQADSPETKAHEESLYRHEVDHFGQAAVWTVASVSLNIMSQKWITENRLPIGEMLFYKTLGAGISAGLLLGGRAYAPEQFRQWDDWTTEHLFSPVMRVTGKAYNVDNSSVERIISEAQNRGKNWADNVSPPNRLNIERYG